MATHFSQPVFVGGVPILGGGGLFSKGVAYFVNPQTGSDGNDGLTIETPLDTLSAAHAKCVEGNGDVVYLLSYDGSATGSARESSTLVWSKDNTHLIGICAPTQVAQRARLATVSGTNFTPLLQVTADNCIFSNFSIFHGYDTAEAQICAEVSGQRNYFQNVCFHGMGHATAGDQGGSASLYLNGGDENTFDDCLIGLDTIARSTTNAELLLNGAATRNLFRRCYFSAFADNAGHLFVKVPDAADMDRWLRFVDCQFENAIGSTATTMTAALSVHASAGGLVSLFNCSLIGATDWHAGTPANVYAYGSSVTANSVGLAAAVAA